MTKATRGKAESAYGEGEVALTPWQLRHNGWRNSFKLPTGPGRAWKIWSYAIAWVAGGLGMYWALPSYGVGQERHYAWALAAVAVGAIAIAAYVRGVKLAEAGEHKGGSQMKTKNTTKSKAEKMVKVQFQVETTLEIDDEMDVPKGVVAQGYTAICEYISEQLKMTGTSGHNVVDERINHDGINVYGKAVKAAKKVA